MIEDTTNKSLKTDLKEEVGLAPLFAVVDKTPAPKPKNEQPREGRVSLAIPKNFAYRRELSLFDSEEIRKRDEEIADLFSQSGDKYLTSDRQTRIVLSPIQDRIISALSCFLDVEDERVKMKIENPFNTRDIPITLQIPLAKLAELVLGGKRTRERVKILMEIDKLSNIKQAQIFKQNGKTRRVIAPYIHAGVSIDTLDPDSTGEGDFIEINYGSIFFVGLNERFAVITPKLLEVSRKQPYQTELFILLKNLLLSVYWQHSIAAKSAEERVRRERRKEKGITVEALEELIREAKFKALSFEIDVDTVLSKLQRNYDDRRRYSEFKRKELPTAVEGLIEMDLLSGYEIIKGKKDQDKVIFHFSETYTTFNKQPIKLPKAIPSGNTPSPF